MKKKIENFQKKLFFKFFEKLIFFCAQNGPENGHSRNQKKLKIGLVYRKLSPNLDFRLPKKYFLANRKSKFGHNFRFPRPIFNFFGFLKWPLSGPFWALKIFEISKKNKLFLKFLMNFKIFDDFWNFWWILKFLMIFEILD